MASLATLWVCEDDAAQQLPRQSFLPNHMRESQQKKTFAFPPPKTQAFSAAGKNSQIEFQATRSNLDIPCYWHLNIVSHLPKLVGAPSII